MAALRTHTHLFLIETEFLSGSEVICAWETLKTRSGPSQNQNLLPHCFLPTSFSSSTFVFTTFWSQSLAEQQTFVPAQKLLTCVIRCAIFLEWQGSVSTCSSTAATSRRHNTNESVKWTVSFQLWDAQGSIVSETFTRVWSGAFNQKEAYFRSQRSKTI